MSNKQRKPIRIRRQTIRNVCYIIVMLAFLFLLGIVGKFENDAMTFGQFTVQSVITFLVLLVSAGTAYHI